MDNNKNTLKTSQLFGFRDSVLVRTERSKSVVTACLPLDMVFILSWRHCNRGVCGAHRRHQIRIRYYVLVNNAQAVDNIVLKRCLNYVDKGGVIICKSASKDPQYPTFALPVENIKEV